MASLIDYFFKDDYVGYQDMDMHLFLKNNVEYNKKLCSIKKMPHNIKPFDNDDIYKFICIRNPESRVVSAIFDKIIINNAKEFPTFLEFYQMDQGSLSEMSNVKKFFLATKFLLLNNSEIVDPHFVSQEFLIPHGVSYNKILIYENLSNDWKDLKNYIKISKLSNVKINQSNSDIFLKEILDNGLYKKSLQNIKLFCEKENHFINNFVKDGIRQ